MPVLDTERQSTPRSALRYRPIHTEQVRSTPVVSRSRRSRAEDTVHTTPSLRLSDIEQGEGQAQPRRQTSVVRRRNTLFSHARRHFHPLFWLGLGLVAILVFWLVISQVVTWGTNKLNDIKYGYPRTFQMNAVLGNGDSPTHPSHLLALNLSGEIILEVFPAGDASHAKDYILTTLAGPESALVPVTLQLIDPGHTGKPDLVINIGAIQSVLVNDQGSFRPPTPVEQQQLLTYLQAQT